MVKKYPKLQKSGISMLFRDGNMCNLNATVVLEFISRDLCLLFAILLSSKFQNSFFYQHMRPKSGLKFPRPFSFRSKMHTSIYGVKTKVMISCAVTAITAQLICAFDNAFAD